MNLMCTVNFYLAPTLALEPVWYGRLKFGCLYVNWKRSTYNEYHDCFKRVISLNFCFYKDKYLTSLTWKKLWGESSWNLPHIFLSTFPATWAKICLSVFFFYCGSWETSLNINFTTSGALCGINKTKTASRKPRIEMKTYLQNFMRTC